MIFTKYSNINVSDIVQESVSRTIGKIMTRTSTKAIDQAFKKFTDTDELLNNIKEIEKKYPREVFKSVLNDLKSIKAIDFHGYSIYPKLDNEDNIISIMVYSLDKDDRYKQRSYKVWESEDSKSVNSVSDKIEDMFFDYLDKDVTFRILGKSTKFNFNNSQKFSSIHEISNSTFDDSFQLELDKIEDDDKLSVAWQDYFDQTVDLIKKAGKSIETSKYGKSVKCKFSFDVNTRDAYIDIDFEFENNGKKYKYSDIYENRNK